MTYRYLCEINPRHGIVISACYFICPHTSVMISHVMWNGYCVLAQIYYLEMILYFTYIIVFGEYRYH